MKCFTQANVSHIRSTSYVYNGNVCVWNGRRRRKKRAKRGQITIAFVSHRRWAPHNILWPHLVGNRHTHNTHNTQHHRKWTSTKATKRDNDNDDNDGNDDNNQRARSTSENRLTGKRCKISYCSHNYSKECYTNVHTIQNVCFMMR